MFLRPLKQILFTSSYLRISSRLSVVLEVFIIALLTVNSSIIELYIILESFLE